MCYFPGMVAVVANIMRERGLYLEMLLLSFGYQALSDLVKVYLDIF